MSGLLSTKEVAEGYGVSVEVIRNHKSRNADEILEDEHFVTNCYEKKKQGRPSTLWTREGVIMLGFFVKSERAKIFRKWASKLILNHIENKNNDYVTKSYLENEYTQTLIKIMQTIAGASHSLLSDKIRLIHNDMILIKERLLYLEKHFFSHKNLLQNTRTAYVYVFHKIGTNEYKIGKSVDPPARKNHFEKSCVKLEIFRTMKFKSEELALVWENTLHQTFQDKRIEGEWFLLDDKDLNYLSNLAKVQEQLS